MENHYMIHMILLGHLQALQQMSTTGSAKRLNSQNLYILNKSMVFSYVHNLFQIADVDSGVIRWVNGDLATYIQPRLLT